jgi:hypothetical protein
MTDQTIECPKCNYEIPLSEALSNQIRQQLQAEVDQRGRERDARLKTEREALEDRARELKRREEAVEDQVKLRLKEAPDQLSADARRKVEEEFSSKLEAATSELEERKTRIKEFQEQELALARERVTLQEQRDALELEKQRQREAIRAELDAEYQKRQAAELKQAREESAKQAREQSELQLKQTTEALDEKTRKVSELQGQELALRKEKQQLEEAKGQLELDVQRKLDEERAGIVESAKKAASEEQRLKERGLQDKISKLSEQLADAQRRIDQGSQESRGEVLEEEMIDSLRTTFPFDLFEDVKKGARGADVLQTLRDAYGKPCGRILWESKNSKNYDKKWIEKLKSDQQECGEEAAVLLTRTQPTGTE